MNNLQQPEKQTLLEDGTLAVHSIFYTIQGEGPFTGHRAVFIRLAGCNLQCPMCDTDYTSERAWLTPNQLLAEVKSLLGLEGVDFWTGALVVITGGEPFRQNLRPAIEALTTEGFEIQVETNGTLYQDLPYHYITVVCSPKAGSINNRLAPHIGALKYVIHDEPDVNDGLPNSALNHPAQPRLARPPENFLGVVYIQPADEQDIEKNQKNLRLAVASVLKYGYVLQLQTHKIIGVA